LFFVQGIDTTKLSIIRISGSDGDDIAVESGDINGGDFYVIAPGTRQVCQRVEFFAAISGPVNISRSGIVDGVGLVGRDGDIKTT